MQDERREISEWEFMERWRRALIAATDAAGEQGAETAAWLGLSKSAYYRRRRGEMPFTAYEYVMLSRRFGLDMQPHTEAVPRFGFDAPLDAAADFSQVRYLTQLEATAELFDQPGQVDILVSATDIPVLYLFAEPDLAALKRYLFGLAIDARGARRFDLAAARKEHGAFVGRVAAVSRAYRQTTREEAWGPSPLRSLVYQILLLVESAAISEADCTQLFDAVERVIDRLERSLTEGVPGEGPLRLWQNRLHATSAIIQLRGPGAERLYVTFDNPNFLASADAGAIAYFTAHFEVLRKRSRRIAGHGLLSPARYARELKQEVARGRERAARVYGELNEEL